MTPTLNQTQQRLAARCNGSRMRQPELIVDFEAENVLLRAALALSEGAGERRELVTQELKHRIGNLLAVVNAVARQTFNESPPQELSDFSARLYALAAAQRLLIESEACLPSSDKIVRDALAAHYPSGDGAKLSGPQLALNGRQAHALTLAPHELATTRSSTGLSPWRRDGSRHPGSKQATDWIWSGESMAARPWLRPRGADWARS